MSSKRLMANRSTLVADLVAEGGYSQAEARRAVDAVLTAMAYVMLESDGLFLLGIGTFTKATRPARKGVKVPGGGEPRDIPPRDTVRYRPHADLVS
ncbi:MAG: HU family DNA-binding protein, partial [Oligoflexia bacterium]|nr:HU family DNA-binding protein [Oligoflexia bacterium]